MKKEFTVERDGRTFVLYAGLLDLAHERGLKAITTTLVQVPTELNGMLAICHATVETEQGTFTGLGDASPSNVTRMMAPHLIRMAETRAKARALRDAVNVGVTALEELGDAEGDEPEQRPAATRSSLRSLEPADLDGAEEPDGEAGARSRSDGARTRFGSNGDGAAAPNGASVNGAAATPKQLQAIERMARVAGKTIETEGLSRAQASQIISTLMNEMGQLRAS